MGTLKPYHAKRTHASQRQQDTTKKRPAAALGLPEGWRIEVLTRKSGATSGTTDKYYISPAGKKFRSFSKVKEDLGME